MKNVSLNEPKCDLSNKNSDLLPGPNRAEPSSSPKDFKARQASPNMNLNKQSRSKVQPSNPFGDSFDESPEKIQANKNPFDEDPDYDESLNPFA